jgi:ABC-2 type transport system ATP-binding protein
MIHIDNLSKSYGKKEKTDILKNINLTIKDGEVTALLGHNGSGKSTLIKCLVGVLKPTSGTVSMDGLDTFRFRKKLIWGMGVVFNQKPSFIVDLSVYDNLLFFKSIYNIKDDDFKHAIELLDNYLNINGLYERPYRKLSFGERVKCEITSVLLHSPKYVILDEPTIGLDYNAKAGLYKLLDYLKKEKGTTVLITTHEVDYIEGICDRAIILSHGEVRYDGTPEKIYHSLDHTVSISIKFSGITDETAAETILKKADSVDRVNGIFTHTCFHAEDKDAYIKEVVKAFSIISVNTESASLREVFEDVLKEIKGTD